MTYNIDLVTIQCLREHVAKLEARLAECKEKAQRLDLDCQSYALRAKKAEAVLAKLNLVDTPTPYIPFKASA